MNLVAGAITALVLLLGAFAGGYKVRADKCENDANLIALAAAAAQKASNEAATDAIGKIRINNRTIKQEVQREIVEKPVYRDCVHEPSVMRNINSALTGQQPSVPVMPKAGASD